MNNSEVYNNIIDPLVMMTGKKKKNINDWVERWPLDALHVLYAHCVICDLVWHSFQQMCICSFMRLIFKSLIHLAAKQIPSGTN